MMLVLRSLVFNVAFYLWTAGMAIASVPALWFDRRHMLQAMALWARGVDWMLRTVVGIEVELRGREHMPAGACIVASKHQSAWDTLAWHALVPDPALVMKKELMRIPVYGALARHAGMIAVDRDAGASAMRGLLRAGQRAKEEGRPIVIFPEGTRSAPGAPPNYQPGVAALYRALHLPVVPVALNSGLVWPRRHFLRPPGRIVLEFLPPIPPGLARDAFMAELENRIETATDRLMADARTKPRGGSQKRG